MDENQLRYQRLYNYTDQQLVYKQYRITIQYPTYAKRIIVRACCEDEIRDSTKEKIVSIKTI
jgi:hypothetical protein